LVSTCPKKWNNCEVFYSFQFSSIHPFFLKLSDWLTLKTLKWHFFPTQYSGPSSLRRHNNRMHSDARNQKSDQDSEDRFDCTFCQLGFSFESALKRHVRRDHKSESKSSHSNNVESNLDENQPGSKYLEGIKNSTSYCHFILPTLWLGVWIVGCVNGTPCSVSCKYCTGTGSQPERKSGNLWREVWTSQRRIILSHLPISGFILYDILMLRIVKYFKLKQKIVSLYRVLNLLLLHIFLSTIVSLVCQFATPQHSKAHRWLQEISLSGMRERVQAGVRHGDYFVQQFYFFDIKLIF